MCRHEGALDLFSFDCHLNLQVLICGDLRGNLLLFPLMKDELLDAPVAPQLKISPMSHFKGAHGISTLSSISVTGCRPNLIEIHSVLNLDEFLCTKIEISCVIY